MSKCLNAKEAAAYLAIGPGTLRNHGPKPIKIGKRNVWPVAALDAWVRERMGVKTEIDTVDDEEAKALAAIERMKPRR